jgi:Conserved carboxylase domain
MAAVGQQEGHPTGGLVNEYDARIYDHQLPGGMTGTFRAQLAQHGMEDRFYAVLGEIPRVRRELGCPVSAAPFSQFIGTQALMNVITGERSCISLRWRMWRRLARPDRCGGTTRSGLTSTSSWRSRSSDGTCDV